MNVDIQKISHFPAPVRACAWSGRARWGEAASGAGLGAPAPGWHVGWNRGNTEAFLWDLKHLIHVMIGGFMGHDLDLTWSYHCCQLWAIKCWELHGGIHDWMVVSWPCIQGNWIEWNWGVTNATMLGLEYHGNIRDTIGYTVTRYDQPYADPGVSENCWFTQCVEMNSNSSREYFDEPSNWRRYLILTCQYAGKICHESMCLIKWTTPSM